MNFSKTSAYAAAVTSTVLLGCLGIFVRNIDSNGYLVTFARLGLGVCFLTFFLFVKNQISNLKISRFSFPLLVTGLLMGLTSLCYINAVEYISLANAVFLLYLGPLLAVGISSIFFKEKLSVQNIVLLSLAFLGFLCLLEFQFSFDPSETKGYIWGISSGICHALYIVFNRQTSEETPALTRSFYQLMIGALMMIPFLDSSVFNLPQGDIGWLLGISFFQGFLAFPLMIYALKKLRAVEFGTVCYVEPLTASLIGFSIYSESLSILQIVGCVIIAVGGIIQICYRRQ